MDPGFSVCLGQRFSCLSLRRSTLDCRFLSVRGDLLRVLPVSLGFLRLASHFWAVLGPSKASRASPLIKSTEGRLDHGFERLAAPSQRIVESRPAARRSGFDYPLHSCLLAAVGGPSPRGLASNISWPSAARNTENTVNTCINRAILRHVSRPLLTYTTTHFYLSHDLPRGTVF